MRHFLLLLFTVTLLSSCSVEKLVSKGDYDRALDKAITKYAKTGKINTDDLKAAEKAYKYIQARDIKRVKAMALREGISWGEMYHLMEIMLGRQELVEMHLPIVSKDRYRADFEMIKMGLLEEEVFNSAQKRDLDAIESLQSRNDRTTANQIFLLYQDIDDRQNAVRNSLPLVSSDGYQARHEFVEIGSDLTDSKHEAIDYTIDLVKEMILLGKNGDKRQARLALEKLEDIDDLGARMQEINDLKKQARYYGMERILVRVENRSSAILYQELEREVEKISVKQFNSKWTQYYNEYDNQKDIDKIATFVIDNIAISPSQETVNHYEDTKTIKDGWEYVLDANGNVKKDTLGNDIKKDRYVEIKADVAEITRFKEVIVSGKLEMRNLNSSRVLESNQVNVNSVFESVFGSYKGDARALSKKSKEVVNFTPQPFPTDVGLTLQAVDILKEEMKRFLTRFS